MFRDLESYFVENIIIPYKEYIRIKKTPRLGLSKDLKSALNLASALFHVREHFPPDSRKNRSEIAILCPDYNLLADVVNASKHHTLTKGNRELSDAKNIYEIIVITIYSDSLGKYTHVEKTIELKLDNGTLRDLHEVIIHVLNMWIGEFKRLNIIKNFRPITLPSKKIYKRSKKSGVLDMEAMRNHSFGPKFRLQIYNYEKKIIEPFDLTGTTINFNMRKLMYQICLTFSNDKREMSIEVELDDKQLKKFQTIKTHEQQVEYLFEQAEKQGKDIKEFITSLKIG